MNEMQKRLLEILKWTDAFCRKNNIRYYLVCGTMLGAARHKGFIPWDDDIDIGMPRGDYERFYSLAKKSSAGRYVVESIMDSAKDFVYPYIKVYDTQTILIENTRYKTKRGLFIDVFPIDGVGNTEEECKQTYHKIKKSLNLFYTKTCAVRKERKLYKNAAIIFSRCIPDFIVSHEKLVKKIDILCSSHSYEDCKYVGNMLGDWGLKEVMNKEIYGEPKEYEFEGLKIFGVSDSDKYLTHIYGDYMKLPPLDKQKTHHDFIYYDPKNSFLNR